MMSHSEPQLPDRSSIIQTDEEVPDVPPELSQLLQQLFVALEDYMNAPSGAMVNIAAGCRIAINQVARPLRDAHWTYRDTVLLLTECFRRLKVDPCDGPSVFDLSRRTAWLAVRIPEWTSAVYLEP